MKSLSPIQRAFVIAYIQTGKRREAYRLAGYSCSSLNAVDVNCHRLMHDERVQAALVEEGRKHIKASAVLAMNYLTELVTNVEADHKDRSKAAIAILDRGGLHALTEHHVNITHHETRESKIQRVIELAKLLGKDPRELLGDLVDAIPSDMKAIDGEAVRVEDTPPVPSTAAHTTALTTEEAPDGDEEDYEDLI